MNTSLRASSSSFSSSSSSRLREWDLAVNGAWPLRAEAEAVFARADVDESGQLEIGELSKMRQTAEHAELVRRRAASRRVWPMALRAWGEER